MKRIIGLLAFLLIISTVNAQLFEVGKFGVGYFYLGPKLGGNLSTVTVEAQTGFDKSINTGYQFGAVAKLGITKRLSIEPEFIYTSRGYGLKSDNVKSHDDYKYFGLPIIAKYAFVAISGIQIYGEGGFYTDVLTKVTSKSVYESGEEWEEEIELTDYKRVDIGLSIGGGAIIPLNSGDQISLDLRYSQGIIDTYDDGIQSEYNVNTSFQLSAVYFFDLTRIFSFRGEKTEEF